MAMGGLGWEEPPLRSARVQKFPQCLCISRYFLAEDRRVLETSQLGPSQAILSTGWGRGRLPEVRGSQPHQEGERKCRTSSGHQWEEVR